LKPTKVNWKKKDDLAKERQKHYQRNIDKTKNQKGATPENPAKVEQIPLKHPCQQEIDACDKLISNLRKITEGPRKKPKNGKILPVEEVVEEEPKPEISDDQPVTLYWGLVLALERISCTVPKTIAEAKELLLVIQDRKMYFFNLGVPPEKRIKKRIEKNGKKGINPNVEEEGDLPADEENLLAEEPVAEESDAEEPAPEELDAEAMEPDLEADDPAVDEAVPDETVEEEPVPEETVEEEPVPEEAVEEEPVPDEEEPVVGETVADEPETVEEEQDVVGDGEQPTKEDNTDEDHDDEGFTMLGGDDDDV